MLTREHLYKRKGEILSNVIKDFKIHISKNIALDIIKECGYKCFAVYVVILSHKNKSYDSCFPSLDVLEKELVISRSSIRRHIDTLVDNGYLAVESGKFGKNSNYFFLKEDFYTEDEIKKIKQRVNRIKGK